MPKVSLAPIALIATVLISGANCPLFEMPGVGAWNECGQLWKDAPSNYKTARIRELVVIGPWQYQIIKQAIGRDPFIQIFEISVANLGSTVMSLPPVSIIGRKRGMAPILHFEYRPLNPTDSLPKAMIQNPGLVTTPNGPGFAPGRNSEVTIPRPLDTLTPFSASEKRDGWLGFACCNNIDAAASWLRVSDGQNSVLIRIF